jgi:PAS domain-containing protein
MLVRLDGVLEYRKKITELEGVKAQSKLLIEALKDSEEKYRSLVDSIDDSIYLIDRQYRYFFMNEKHITRMGLLRHYISVKNLVYFTHLMKQTGTKTSHGTD